MCCNGCEVVKHGGGACKINGNIERGGVSRGILNISNFIHDSDCATVVRRIKEGKFDLSPLGHMIGSLQQLFLNNSQMRIRYVCRKATVLAHLLAKRGCDISNSSIWLEEVPVFVNQAYMADKVDIY